MLHIVKTSTSLDSVLAYCLNDDEILLMEHAVYFANPQHAMYQSIVSSGVALSVLKEDVDARGLSDLMGQAIKIVDFSGFVELTAQHTQSITWA